MYSIEYTTRFRRSFKKCMKPGLDVAVFERAVRSLLATPLREGYVISRLTPPLR